MTAPPRPKKAKIPVDPSSWVVTRHTPTFEDDFYQSFYDRSLESWEEWKSMERGVFAYFANDAKDAFYHSLQLCPHNSLDWLERWLNIRAALLPFAAQEKTEEIEIDLPYLGKIIALDNKNFKLRSPFETFESVMAAVAVNHQSMLEAVRPLDETFHQSQKPRREYTWPLTFAVLAMHDGEDDRAAEHCDDAETRMEEFLDTRPGTLREKCTNRFAPWTKLARAILEGKEVDEALHEALIGHRAYWAVNHGLNRGDTWLCNDIEGFVALHLAGFVRLAQKRGIRTFVTSGYLPTWLIR